MTAEHVEHAENRGNGGARRRLLPVLAALAVLAVTGGVGYALSSVSGGDRPPQLRLSATGSSGAAAVTLEAGLPAEYHLTGALPDGPGEARVHRLADRPLDAAAVRPLARAVNITGTPRENPDAWAAGGLGAMLRVGKHAGQQWDVTPMGSAASDCARPSRGLPDGSGLTPCSPVPVPPLPAQAAARAGAVFAAVGLPADQARTSPSGRLTTLTVDPAVDGRPSTGYATSVSVAARGVHAAHGWLGRPMAGDTYPVISAEQALAELRRNPRPLPIPDVWAPAAVPTPVDPARPGTPKTRPSSGPGPGAGPGAGSSGNSGSAAQPDPAAVPGSVPPAPPADVAPDQSGAVVTEPPRPRLEIRQVRFGYSLQWQDGEPLLVPSWLFDIAQPQMTVAQVAVDPAYLSPAGTAEPGATASRDPDAPVTVAPPAPANPPSREPAATPSETVITDPPSAFPTPPTGAEPAPAVPSGPFNGLTRITRARITGDGSTLSLTVDGGAATGPCRTTYTAWAKPDGNRVVVAVQGEIPQPFTEVRCRTSGTARTVTVRLDGPAGGRTLVDAATGRPVPR